ncbi:Protein of unknown function [Gryllus bimaculatus]|nr:Protein of unknown function [Gryllus bimaculatus]
MFARAQRSARFLPAAAAVARRERCDCGGGAAVAEEAVTEMEVALTVMTEAAAAADATREGAEIGMEKVVVVDVSDGGGGGGDGCDVGTVLSWFANSGSSAHPLTINGNLRLDDDGVIAGLMHSLHDQDQGRIPRPSSDRDFPDYFCTCKKRVVLPVALLHARGRVKEIFSRD